jgi:hypothetical protein
MALRDSAASLAAEGGDELAGMLLRFRLRAVYHLNELADSARQAIAVGEPLAADSKKGAGPGPPWHPYPAEQPRQRPQGSERADWIVPCAARDASVEPIG